MSWHQAILDLQSFVDGELSHRPSIRLLEAGCGSASHLTFRGAVQRVGIDISEKQLERNTVLNEKIVGDLQQHEFPPASFDAIICWDVLEHLAQPELALRQFGRAIKPGGLIILKLPNVLSVKGLVTKGLPHTLHVLAYRYIYHDPEAGKDDRAPFKTHLRFNISARAIRRQGVQLGLRTAYFATADVAGIAWLQRRKLVNYSYLMFKHIFGWLSLGRLGDSELFIVLTKG
jgi:SAM-dependent methyltransferase